MALRTRRYTRFVALSKHLLWTVALLIVAALVWIASDNTGEKGARLVFSNVPQSEKLQNIMEKPHYQGVDDKDRPYTVVADTATQQDADNVLMETVSADMTGDNGAWMAVNAGVGVLNLKTKQLELQDKVDMFYEGGYEFRTDHVHVDIEQGKAYGDSKIEGQGPQGTLTADSFEVLERGKEIRFNGSVRMTLYR